MNIWMCESSVQMDCKKTRNCWFICNSVCSSPSQWTESLLQYVIMYEARIHHFTPESSPFTIINRTSNDWDINSSVYWLFADFKKLSLLNILSESIVYKYCRKLEKTLCRRFDCRIKSILNKKCFCQERCAVCWRSQFKVFTDSNVVSNSNLA